MFRNLFNHNKVILGRWEHRLKPSQIERKFLFNNLDHCGDKICGELKYYKSKIIKNKKDMKIRKMIH